jgi:hypothetical protein
MDGSTTAFLGTLIAYSGDWDRGCAIAERAPQLNPHHPGWYNFAAYLNADHKCEYRASSSRAAALGQFGQRATAQKAVKNLIAIRPDFRRWRARTSTSGSSRVGRPHHRRPTQAGLEISDDEERQTPSLQPTQDRKTFRARESPHCAK